MNQNLIFNSIIYNNNVVHELLRDEEIESNGLSFFCFYSNWSLRNIVSSTIILYFVLSLTAIHFKNSHVFYAHENIGKCKIVQYLVTRIPKVLY